MLSINKTVDVDTGELRVSSERAVLRSIALGSCVAFVVYEPDGKIGGLAHIMLPGKSPSNNNNTKYAEDAIDALLNSVEKLGAKIENLEISIVGGANILQEGDLPDLITKSIIDCLEKLDLEVSGMRVGGVERRSVFLNTATGNVYYVEGDNPNKILLTKITKV
ncbi:MAG: hypothetical protein DRP51_03500 [Candidatus Zixiibacteriota bacterium]|nr:MAG: hypothetical protein DRP51_03500 [candidate division Zixibacteria bacterium]